MSTTALASWIETVKQAHDESLDGEHESARGILRDLLDGMEAALAAPAPQPEAQAVEAWASDDGRVISAQQKATALRDGGASASSVRPFSIALGRLAAPAAPAQQPLTDAERTELLDWVSACQSSYHVESTLGHRFGALAGNLTGNREALVRYVNGLLAARARSQP